MPHSFSLLRASVIAATCSSLLGGCVLAVVGAAGAGGYTMGQERGPGGVVSDTEIKTVLNAKWTKDDSRILTYVDLNIFEGRVLLTGDVPTPDIRDEAVADAQKVNGVKEVINNINVGQRSTFGSNTSDNWILTRLRSALTFDGKVSSLNYSLQVVDGTVYILGSAKDQDELDRVVNHARNTPDVVKVVSYIRIRPGAGAGSDAGGSGATYQNTPPAPPPVQYGDGSGGASSTEAPSSASSPPIETQPVAPTYSPPAYNAPLPAPSTAAPVTAPRMLTPPAAPPASSGPGTVQEQPL